jgi:hypothetical protein
MHDGKFSGRGVMTLAGTTYDGEWKDGKQNGHGIFWAANKLDHYEGEFGDGKPNGQGVWTDVLGDRYEGGFCDDKYCRHGVFTWANGGRFEGEFSNNKPNGFGTYTTKSETVAGEWTDGCVQKDSKPYCPVPWP